MNIEDYHTLDKHILSLKFSYKEIDIRYILRNHLVTLLRNKDNKGNKEIGINGSVMKRFLFSALKTSLHFFKRKPVWVFSNAERRKKIGGIYIDRVASLVSEVNPQALYIENPVISNHKKPTKDIILSDAIFFICSFLFSIFYYKKKHLHIDESVLGIAKEYDIKPNIEPLIKRFVGQYRFMKFYLKYVSKPKKVFSVYPNGYYGYNYAFKEFQIPIIELQHGVIYPLHPSYNTILFESAQTFKPDYIFTYGTKDKECLTSLNYIDKDKIHVVGSYGLWKIKQQKLEVSSYLISQLSTKFKTLAVVATTNDIEELYQWCISLENIYSKLNILLLPRFQVTKYASTNQVKVLDVNATNIFEIYQVADFLITKNSTAALEALYMKIPTFVYDPKGTSVFKKNYSYISSLNYIASIEEFKHAAEYKNFKEPLAEDVNQVYAKHVLINFNKAMQTIRG